MTYLRITIASLLLVAAPELAHAQAANEVPPGSVVVPSGYAAPGNGAQTIVVVTPYPAAGAPQEGAPQSQAQPYVPGPAPAPYAPGYGQPQPYGQGYAAPQAYGTPQYAPGYQQPYAQGYATPVQLEMAAIDQHLAELRARRPSLGGPIALLATGGGLAIFGLYAALIAAETASFDSEFSTSGTDYRKARIFTGVAVVGAAMAVGGLVWMLKRSHERRAMNPEINAYRARRRQLMQFSGYGAATDGRNHHLNLSFRF